MSVGQSHRCQCISLCCIGEPQKKNVCVLSYGDVNVEDLRCMVSFPLFRKGSPEKRIEKEQKTTNDGPSCSVEDERSQTDYPGHGEVR